MRKHRMIVTGILLLGLILISLGIPAGAGNSLSVPTGEGFVVYSPHAGASFGVPELIGSALTAAKTEVTAYGAVCENGALVFEIGGENGYFWFRTEQGYLATNNAEEVFLSPELSDTTENCGFWYFTESGSHLVFNSKTARYKDRAINIEYYSSVFSGWTYHSESASIYEFEILPLAAEEPVARGVVDKPSVTLKALSECIPGQPFSFTVQTDSLFGLNGEGLRVEGAGVPLEADARGVYTLPAENLAAVDEIRKVLGGMETLHEKRGKPLTYDLISLFELRTDDPAAVKSTISEFMGEGFPVRIRAVTANGLTVATLNPRGLKGKLSYLYSISEENGDVPVLTLRKIEKK